MRLVAATLRYRIHDPHGFTGRKDFGPAIYCVWHNRLALCLKFILPIGRRHHRAAGLAALVSASKDGAFLTAILECFGVATRARFLAAGAARRHCCELTTWAERGYDLAITPDGPRGPRYTVQDGAMALAQITGLPMVPVVVSFALENRVEKLGPLSNSSAVLALRRLCRADRPGAARNLGCRREKLRQQLETELRAMTRD